jgi:hypothetical protein
MRRQLAPSRGRRSHDGGGTPHVAPSGLVAHPDLLNRRRDTAVALQETAGNAAVASRLRVVQRDAESQGYGVEQGGTAHTITRPEQVLSEYGMTCYGTSVMFMLQSYGLVPPDMTRAEFEHAFTPLNPLHRGGEKTGPITVGGVEQKNAVPIDLITKGLQGTERPSKRDSSLGKITTTEATLRGADRGSMRVSDIMARMPVILASFAAQADKPGYQFLKANHAPGGAYTADAKGERWTDATADLNGGKLTADYFKDGNTVMTAVHLDYPPEGTLDHWVVIVKESTTITVGGTKHHLYPADDPLFGRVMVLAPKIGRIGEDALKKAGLTAAGGQLESGGIRVHLAFGGGQAFRRRSAKYK